MPTEESANPRQDSRWTALGVCVFLAIATWLVFGQTLQHEFVNFDDDVYVYENPVVKGGLTRNAIVWAFTQSHADNWHPLTWLSLSVDCAIFGCKPGPLHLVNLLFHAANAILLFLVLRKMTGAVWRSAFVAALFAVHPLRVESVAWIAERKDVLSAFFGLLAIWAYARHVQNLKSGSQNPENQRCPPFFYFLTSNSYLLSLALFSLSLMSKPMLVSLPFLLLLLDCWPMQRAPSVFSLFGSRFSWLILEKLPFLALSAAICVATLRAQSHVIRSSEAISFPFRIGNALVSCATYLKQLVYPAGLAAFYPYPANLPAGDIIVALIVLGAISAMAFLWRNKRPWLLIGWLWYLGMLMPVIGLVQVGSQAHADRYTYLPQIGLYLLLTWTAVECSASWRCRRWVLGGGAAVIIGALLACARAQTAHWRDSESLWTHALDCTGSANPVAQSNLGNALFRKGRFDEAVVYFRKALAIRPDYPEAQSNLGNTLLQKGQLDEAAHCFQSAIEIQRDYPEAHNALGFALLQKGQINESIAHFQEALRIEPAFAAAHNNFGMALLQRENVDEAIIHFQNALAIDPSLGDTHNNLGAALIRKGRAEEAVVHYEKALELKPDDAGANNNLAWALATYPQASIRNGPKAVELAQRARQLSGGSNLIIWRTLAAAYAEAGRFHEAIDAAGQAFQLAANQGNAPWADALQSEIKLYQSGQPLRIAASQ